MSVNQTTALPTPNVVSPQLQDTLDEIALLQSRAAEGKSVDLGRVAELQKTLAAALRGLKSEADSFFRQQGIDVPDLRDSHALAGTAVSVDGAMQQVSTDIYAFMQAYTKIMQQMRAAAREQRTAELDSQASAIRGSAAEIRTAAAERYTAAVIEGSMQIASGAISMGAATISLGVIAMASKGDLAPGSALLAKLNNMNQLMTGLTQTGEGTGKIIAAGHTMAASEADARAKENEADATAAQARRQSAQEAFQATTDTLNDIRARLAAIEQSNIETNRGMARNV